MKLRKIFTIGLIAITLLISSTPAYALFEDKECKLSDALSNFGVFMSSVIGYSDFTEYWQDIGKSLKHKTAHFNAINNVLTKLDRIRKAIRDAYLRCDQIAVDKLKKTYYKAQVELKYVRNYNDKNILRTLKEKFKDYFTAEAIGSIYAELEAGYKPYHAEWDSAKTAEIRELIEAWNRFLETFSQGGKDFVASAKDVAKEGVKQFKPEEHKAPMTAVVDYLLEHLEVRMENVSAPLSIRDIVDGNAGGILNEAKENIGRELEEDFDVKSEPGLENPFETGEKIAEGIKEGNKAVDSAKVQTLPEIWEKFKEADVYYMEEISKEDMMTRYDIIFRSSGDTATESLKKLLEQTKTVIHESLLPMAKIAKCAELTQSRQCTK